MPYLSTNSFKRFALAFAFSVVAFLHSAQILITHLFNMNIYIANLNSTIDEQELEQLFTAYGRVTSAQIMKDLPSGESRGFGYVEMEDDAAAQKAIDQLNEMEWQTLTISVKEEKA